MKFKIKPLSAYLFTFIPIIAICSIIDIGTKSVTSSHSNGKTINNRKAISGTAALPCNFPDKGIVSGETATFYASESAPILFYWGDLGNPNQYPAVPSSVTVGNIKLELGSNGVLVLYENGVNCWDSGNTAQSNQNDFSLWLQNDGNLVLRTGNTYNDPVIWAANIYTTCANGNYAYYTLQSDGNFVMRYPHQYNGTLDANESDHTNVDSYALGDTNTANAHHNSNHKIQ